MVRYLMNVHALMYICNLYKYILYMNIMHLGVSGCTSESGCVCIHLFEKKDKDIQVPLKAKLTLVQSGALYNIVYYIYNIQYILLYLYILQISE